MRTTMFIGLVLAVATTAGCGSSETPNATGANGQTGANNAAAARPDVATVSQMIAGSATAPTDPIQRAVYDFLEAVRVGDSVALSQRFTPLALQRVQEADSAILPPGSDTARFKVGNSEQLAEDRAVCDSVWTDLDVDGKPSDEPILWALRLIDGQWRISGMVAYTGPDTEPITINFEQSLEPQKPQQKVDPAMIAGGTTAPASEPQSEVARNPFDQPAQR